MQTDVIPQDGMVITRDTQFAPGVYVLPNGISIGADDITLAGSQTMLLSPAQSGVGIHANNRRNVTVRDLSISGYYHGVRLDSCQNVRIEAIRVRDTYEIPGVDTFLYLWQPVEEAYGGAVLFNQVQQAVIKGCDLQHQMNGILLYGCEEVRVEDNNASFNSGRGVYLSATSESVIQDNRLDFCNRMYRRPEDGSMRAEADTASIVLVKASSRNRVLRNSCVGGGDGIFVAGYEHPGSITPCNDNLFEDNDCRLSPNNAIESTFSRGNIFRRNDCSRSNYGFWLGFSWDNTLEDNIVEFNRFAGIAAEHAHNMTLRNNRIRLNGEGVRLWTRGGAVVPYWPGYEVSYGFTLENNLFETNQVGFAGYTGDETTDQECHGFVLRANTFADNRVGAHFARVRDCILEDNRFSQQVECAVRLVGKPGVTTSSNVFEDNAADVKEL
jgi:parallel beta-helix repeat protein